MPSALRVPICEPTSRSGICITRTSVERNRKQTIIATPSVIDIFTMVHRKSSKCSRNGLEVSLSGKSRNLKMSCSAMGQEFEIRMSKQSPKAQMLESFLESFPRKGRTSPLHAILFGNCGARGSDAPYQMQQTHA